MPNEPEDVAKVEDIHSVKQEEVSDKIEEVNATNEVGEEQVMAVSPVTIRITSPANPRTLPKTSEPLTSLILLPQPQETVQELKLAVNEWVGGYWLGPYSLRIPEGKGKKAEAITKTVGTAEKEAIHIREKERLSEWLEVAEIFAGFEEKDERILEVVREPYTDFTARQSVLRLLELVAPTGSSTNTSPASLAFNAGSTIFESVRDGTSIEPTFQEVEVALPGRKTKGKKEMVKVKKEVEHAFADWTDSWPATSFDRLPFSQQGAEVLPCAKNIQISPFNPPPPNLRQKGHQLYLQVATLEGETHTLVCTSRGWYDSRTSASNFDPAPRTSSDNIASPISHSLIDLLHTLSPQFSERLSKLPPLAMTPPPLEPVSTVPIPQAEPAYPFLATPPKPAVVPDAVRSQLAFIHSGAMTADSLDGARDWNEEIQGIKELPRDSMQERVLREKMAQKTWAEFTEASVRCVLSVARGDIPPLNPNEDPRSHMFLISNIFITKAVDSIDAYAHLGGDAAAHASHSKDAAGVRYLNNLDIDGVHLLGHTVVDWAGERWVCQSMLPGIFARRRDEEEMDVTPSTEETEIKKEDWVQVSDSPVKSAATVDSGDRLPAQSNERSSEEATENPLIIYGLDSEHMKSIHWDKSTHKIMSKIATVLRLAPHTVKDGSGKPFEFYASAEVKALRGTDGRRYLLDLPRMSPVDIEWLEKDIDGKVLGTDEAGPNYPHRVVLLRPELIQTFWESELKRWAREAAAKNAEEKTESADGEASAYEKEAASSKPLDLEAESSPAASAAAAQRTETEAPLDTTVDSISLDGFDLRLNPDAFVDQPPAKDSQGSQVFVPSTVKDDSEASIKAVRDASVFLRQVALPAVVLDVLTGNTSGIMDGASLSKHLHGRGINIRYLGYLTTTIDSFAAGPVGENRESGHLAAFKGIVVQEMIFRAAKHILRHILAGHQPEHATCALSHFLNCLLGTAVNSAPHAVYDAFDLSGGSAEPAYVKLTPESVRQSIVDEIKCRFRWKLTDLVFETYLKKRQLLRALAMRTGFQLVQRKYAFDKSEKTSSSEDDKENKAPSPKDKNEKKTKKQTPSRGRDSTFEPADILTLIPIVRTTAPGCAIAEEIFEAGRATINRGNLDLGLDFLLEAVQLYENVHSVIHPEVAAAYNQYSSTIHQLARLKIQQLANENADPEQPLGLDIATALRLQRQAVIISERTLGVYHPETCAYYFNLAMLENMEGNGQASLRYFRHVLKMWDVIHGPGHPEINTVLSNAGVVLQTLSEHAVSLSLLVLAHHSTSELFGQEHIQTAQSLHQLTQAHFLAGDIPSALAASEKALNIFESRLGKEHSQTKEVARNVELLRAVVENVEKQKVAGVPSRERQVERLHAAQARVGGGSVRRRLGSSLAGANGSSNATPGASAVTVPADEIAASSSRIGERGHLDVDELVKFIQGGPAKSTTSRGKNNLRGKRRTGAKR